MRDYDTIMAELTNLLERLNTLIGDPQELTMAEHEEATHLSAILDMVIILQSMHDPNHVLPAMAQLGRVLGAHTLEHLGAWGDMDMLEKPRPAEGEDPEAPAA
jgi:hypothetical protein